MEEEKKPTEVESTNEETPEAPEAQAEVSSPEPEAPAEPAEPDPIEEPAEEQKPSRRESLRIQQLLSKMKQPADPATPTPLGIDYAKDLDADPEVVERLTADKKLATDAAFREGMERTKYIQFETRLEVDAPRVEAKFPQLDKSSPNFHPVVADALNRAYLSAVGYDPTNNTVANPNLRYADYIEAQFELADEIASERMEKSTQNIAKQAAQTGLRPDGSAAKRLNLNKAPEAMTDEELQAVLAQAGVATPKK